MQCHGWRQANQNVYFCDRKPMWLLVVAVYCYLILAECCVLPCSNSSGLEQCRQLTIGNLRNRFCKLPIEICFPMTCYTCMNNGYESSIGFDFACDCSVVCIFRFYEFSCLNYKDGFAALLYMFPMFSINHLTGSSPWQLCLAQGHLCFVHSITNNH